MPRPNAAVVSSALFSKRWVIPEIGTVRATLPVQSALAEVDSSWPALRQASDLHSHWRWTDLLKEKAERFALASEQRTVALWCSAKHRPLQLPAGRFYRLDYFEIRPDLRGGALGAFAFATIAIRAMEVGSDGIILAALPSPGLCRFYAGLGGEQRLVQGWQVPCDLAPYVFPKQAVHRLVELSDGFVVESGQESRVHGDGP